MKWQPIETAPKELERVLLNIHVSATDDHPATDCVTIGYHQPNSGKWLVNGNFLLLFPNESLTHWMPLPKGAVV